MSVRDLVNHTVKPFAVAADKKGLELIVETSDRIADQLTGDPVRIRQILGNLLGNAVKFTERGHVLLQVDLAPSPAGRNALHVRVTDTGIGIPQEKHAAIFEAFSQADGSTTRRFGGTGLGLSISARLVQMMGGRIWLESTPGAGSTFHVTFEAGIAHETPAVLVRPDLPQVSVLVVDDNVVNRRIFHEQLTRWGMQPVAVDSGRAAIDALADAKSAGRPFALVLLDANMPDLDGFAVAEEIGRRPELADATIMMLTSSGEYGDTSRCRELGIAAYLVKPVRQLDLAEAIARAMSAPAVAPAAPNVVPLPVIQRSFRRMHVLLAEDNIVNQRVAVRLLTKRGHHVTVASNGREALEAIERTAFDVVLMDVQMPEMGGIEATAVIRDRERTLGGRLRIVAMTAHALKGDRERCFAAGMDGYLSKPIDRLQLFDAVELAPSHGEAAITPASFSGFNYRDLSERLGGDPQLGRRGRPGVPRRLSAVASKRAGGDRRK